MKKIIITGGLGYIGTELCKLYSGESWINKIIVIDKRFVSERVKQLRDWGIEFIQGDILDETLMSQILPDSDVIIHLAGITDVAYVKTESNIEKDREITVTGIDGTNNIIKYSGEKTKIIFPSTHVVYEGFQETKFDITEEVPFCPVLTYSKSKSQSEIDFFNSNKDFVILRLASVYGYSTDTMRINIMPNLFSKITSQDGIIKLFSGGVQYKSLVSVFDVVRAFKFLSESGVTREIFHISNESLTIKEVAEICKEINPKVQIIETTDEIPNLGYTISNEKIKKLGFEFLYDIKTCMKDMIHNWSMKKQNHELEFKLKGEKEFVDSRGRISNYELTEPINLIGYIESVKGSVRANHYHPIQEQKCLLIKGRYVSVIKNLLVENSPIETKIINPGDIAVIKPNVAHAMVFLEDSIFLNLVRGEREHENYGITHTIPFELVDEKLRTNILQNYSQKCRSCSNTDLKDVVSLGMSPLANNLLSSKNDVTELYPLEVKYCPICHNSQLSYVVEPEKMFDNYLYVSSTASSFREHFSRTAQKYIEEFELTSKDLVVDIGSNDGIALKPLQDKGIKVFGVEPAKNISELANSNGIPTLNSYFDESAVDYIRKNLGEVKIVTASNVFAHSDKLVEITKNAFNLLKKDGFFIIEVQYLKNTINDLTFDNIYHEHVNYWCVSSLNNFFESLGFHINKVEHINTHGGSIRVYISREIMYMDESVEKYLSDEKEYGLLNYSTYENFRDNVNKVKQNVLDNFKDLKSKYKKISAYGSPAKATTSLNFYGIDDSFIDFTIEDNELKNNKIIPGVNIPIKNKEYCLKNLPDVIVVLAWNFYDYILENNKELLDKGVKFINIKDLQQKNYVSQKI